MERVSPCQGVSLPNLYDELYRRADAVLKRINPCQIENADGYVSCVASRAGRECQGELCCSRCNHLGVDGCRVQALACKLWLCWYVQGTARGRQAAQELAVLQKVSQKAGLWPKYRASKESHFRIL